MQLIVKPVRTMDSSAGTPALEVMLTASMHFPGVYQPQPIVP